MRYRLPSVYSIHSLRYSEKSFLGSRAFAPWNINSHATEVNHTGNCSYSVCESFFLGEDLRKKIETDLLIGSSDVTATWWRLMGNGLPACLPACPIFLIKGKPGEIKKLPGGSRRSRVWVGVTLNRKGSTCMCICTHCTEYPTYVFPEIKLCGLVPDSYIHVSVSDLYIPRIGLPIWLQQNRQTNPRNI
jgi:hypothetical protein